MGRGRSAAMVRHYVPGVKHTKRANPKKPKSRPLPKARPKSVAVGLLHDISRQIAIPQHAPNVSNMTCSITISPIPRKTRDVLAMWSTKITPGNTPDRNELIPTSDRCTPSWDAPGDGN